MSFFNSNTISAKRVGPNLVATFPTANPPLIWKFDLERNHSFTIALQGDNGDWELGITSPKGEFYPIAHFPMKEDAEEALNKVQKVLMKKGYSFFKKTLNWLGAAFLLLILLFFFGFLPFRPGPSFGVFSSFSTVGQKVMAVFKGPSSGVAQGVPVSADDVLKPPQ